MMVTAAKTESEKLRKSKIRSVQDKADLDQFICSLSVCKRYVADPADQFIEGGSICRVVKDSVILKTLLQPGCLQNLYLSHETNCPWGHLLDFVFWLLPKSL